MGMYGWKIRRPAVRRMRQAGQRGSTESRRRACCLGMQRRTRQGSLGCSKQPEQCLLACALFANGNSRKSSLKLQSENQSLKASGLARDRLAKTRRQGSSCCAAGTRSKDADPMLGCCSERKSSLARVRAIASIHQFRHQRILARSVNDSQLS